MSLRPGEKPGSGIAVFPFLKTSDPVQLGKFTFKSTEDTSGLSDEDATHVREVAEMLFFKDDLRIQSASYAILPPLDLDRADPLLTELEHIQSVVAYCYASPHPTFGTPFLRSEETSLVIFSPEPVTTFLARPEHHVVATDTSFSLAADEWHRVMGYQGRYNFRHPFWAVKGSRLYPPVPHIGLNLSQDLAGDLASFFSVPQHALLPNLLLQPSTIVGERVLTALKWHSRANATENDEDCAMLDLAVAFETLLALPEDAKTNRFVDAISLLLGRVPRLNQWAEQFYAARSEVAHAGRAERLRFALVKQKTADSALYQPLMVYGRQIFRLCVGTLSFGAHVAEKAGLQQKLITNQERFQSVCKILDDTEIPVVDRFAALADITASIDEYRFVGETGLLVETMVGAIQRAATNLLLCDISLDATIEGRIESLATAPKCADSYDALAALCALKETKLAEFPDPRSPHGITQRLADVVWHYTFMHYFWLKKQHEAQTKSEKS
jgi:hypothetical protein